ncbi:TPA: Mor transcription activator family protein [Yersinia enterocolitica]|uniref:Mor transcription activator family protein n=1 Tax=Yersinia TaxID=629 RepID=UPI0005E000BD|nr:MULTISPECIES: Mor transcription activator family protein [Yersinia]EKN3486050.1 transcriptional regulator [Yersinia enterocolitica]EKN3979060.1 transcriptional regulator [Yersinia enterocolitica]EKN3983058.1 transcriptional regulator [Yersinia enterocolitica]EKN6222327.1 transcriptional regulator [Yersinia enterocolitica]ELI8405241.1 transcriptional regulator [Yersinia enterocolitica]
MADNLELFDDSQDDSILEHLEGGDSERGRFPELLKQINELLRCELERLGGNGKHSLELVVAISKQIGGSQVYFPRGQVLEDLVRDMRIWRDFDGHNIHELVERYHVTYKTVYKAIRRMRKLESKKRQPELF